MIVLAIDPGSHKCGLGIVSPKGILHREIAATEALAERVNALRNQFTPSVILMGNGTRSVALEAALGVEIVRVPESHTTERARQRYWQENPLQGLARLWPTSLRTPPGPVDDWVAVILAEDWLQKQEQRSE
ncbi:MAG: hypothetical protein QM758_16330 [Armatimonas sp.]